MKHTYVLPLADHRTSLETVGGKGASLARLVNAGLPVPDGFHVTTAAYQEFVTANDLQPFILETVRDVDISQPAALETASRAIQERFAQGQMPEDIAEVIAQAYIELPGDHPVVAVRSSATAEDLPGLSFAGQQETFLNIHGLADVLEAVQHCWASLWTARAIGYRHQHGIDQKAVSLAVVVQILVHAEASGILFTANPVTGLRDQAVISASWGLGEAIVGGLVTPDTFTVDKASGRVLHREIAEKQVMTVLLESSTAEHPVPETMRQVPALSDQQTAELNGLGVQIEQLYGIPMDIEWAWAEGQFFILQARPVTALPGEELPAEVEAPEAVEWVIPDPRSRYARGSIVDFLPDPLSPLFDTLGKPLFNTGLNKTISELTGGEQSLGFSMITVNGYAYMGTNINLRFLLKFGALLIRKMAWLIRTAEQRWREEALPQYAAVVTHWQGQPVEELSSTELVAGVNEIMQETIHYFNVLQTGVLGTAGSAEAVFSGVYGKLAQREGDPPAATFVMGYDSIPIRAEKALYDLAGWCREHSELAGFLLDTPTARLVNCLAADLLGGLVLPESEAALWAEWLGKMKAYLQTYGHSLYDLDFSKPTPADDPAPILETLKLYLKGGGQDPYQRQGDLACRREQAVRDLLGRLRGLRLKIIRKALNFAQGFAPLREDCIADMGLGYPLLRQMLLELGQRFARVGAISQSEEIFWLEIGEVKLTVEKLDAGLPVSCLDPLVLERKALWQERKRLSPPPMLPVKSKIAGINMGKWLPVDASEQTGEVIKGLGASPGQVTATARVLNGPQDFQQMQPGDILVAAITTPAWTPLFAMAAGVVTDVGGPLSHGSIVAREYGIPAVLGTGVATRRIHSGQVITVDGSNGTVTLEAGERIKITELAPIDWKLPDPKGQYMRASICELLPDPLTPLFDSLGMQSIENGINVMSKDLFDMPLDSLAGFMLAINGYTYQKVSFTPRQWWYILSRMMPRMPRILREGVSYWQNVAHPRYAEVTARWRKQTPANLSSTEIWTGIHEIMAGFAHHLGSLMASTMGPSAGSEGLFTQVYKKMIMRPDDPDAPAFLMGFDSIPIKAEKALYDLAGWCREQTNALTDYLIAAPADQITVQIERDSPPEGVSDEQWKEFRSRFRQYLEEYGYSIYNMDFAKPLPIDQPEPILETFKLFLTVQGKDPYERQQAYAGRREAAVAAMRARLKGFKRWAFEKTLKWAQSQAPLREDGIAEIGLGYPVLRQLLLELGRRFAKAGAIPQAADIFWLETGEVAAAVTALERGESLKDYAGPIRERKSLWERRKRLTPPAQLPPGKKYLGLNVEGILAVGESTQAGSTIKGVGASPGQVRGTARVLHGPEDFGEMQPGEVLVASITTPAWTPLFAMAAGIVTDIGGPLSHGSIVAREYGIPAVLGTGVATRRIHNGQEITVDGTTGLVTLSSDGSENGRHTA